MAWVAAGTLALTFPLNALVGRDFIPADDQSELTVVFDAPVGTSLQGTAKIADAAGDEIERNRAVSFAWASVLNEDNHGQVYVGLTDVSKRKASSTDVGNQIREILAKPEYSDLRSVVLLPSVLGSSIDYGTIRPLILGPDFYGAAKIAEQSAEEMRKIKGLVDVSAEVNLNTPELQVKIDRQRASDLGVRASDIANAVRLMVAGTDQISTYKEGSEQYDVTMQLLPEQQRNLDLLARLMIPSAKVGQVRLDSVATLERGVGPTVIDRYNRQFQVALTANNSASLPFDAAVREISAAIERVPHPNYFVKFTGTVKILDETTRSLIVAFLLACIFMYMVLAAQFDSFLHPFTIMLSLPLSIPFALLDTVAHAPDSQFVERVGCLPVTRRGQEKRNSSGGLHKSTAQRGHALARGHRSRQPRPAAAHLDDDAGDCRRVGAHGDRNRSRRVAKVCHRADNYRRTIVVLAPYAPDYTGSLFFFRRT